MNEWGRCAKCKQVRPIVNKKYGLCLACNRDRLKIVKHPILKKRGTQPTGELEMFKKIWNARLKISAISGEGLLKYNLPGTFHYMFHHVFPKGKYPKYRLRYENVILVTPEEHYMIHNIAPSDWPLTMRERYEQLKTDIWNKLTKE